LSDIDELVKKAAWELTVPEHLLERPEFEFVPDIEGNPRALLIGDSISMGYTVPVRKLLSDKINIHRIPQNGEHTPTGLNNLDKWLGDGGWDLVHFNFGLHDIKRLKGDKLDVAGDLNVSLEEYEMNLDAIVRQLKETGAKLVWAATTPVQEGSHGRKSGDEIQYNNTAAKVMEKQQVYVNDLHTFVMPELKKYQLPNGNVHYNQEGYEFLGKKVAAVIQDQIVM